MDTGYAAARSSRRTRRHYHTALERGSAPVLPDGRRRRATLTSVRDNLRHASITTTSIYLDDDEVMRTWQIERIFARRTSA
ncbi:hypothetical protein WJ45_09660 [Burkholderia ubonensis]|nr:hypothetical protein WJ45_09660 [Burkholderia ubonensis]KVQ49107.1 hypothetical protein WK04_08055 [Burkholderia ubonensis]